MYIVHGQSLYGYMGTFCDIINHCGMPAHKMKTGCVNFHRHEPQIGYLATSLKRAVAIWTHCYKAH